MRDEQGGELFKNIQITLVCDACMKTDHPEKCTHKLSSMPRWLSSKKVETVKQLLADDPAMLLRESMGISADGSQKAFSARSIEEFLARKCPELTVRNAPLLFLELSLSFTRFDTHTHDAAYELTTTLCAPTVQSAQQHEECEQLFRRGGPLWRRHFGVFDRNAGYDRRRGIAGATKT